MKTLSSIAPPSSSQLPRSSRRLPSAPSPDGTGILPVPRHINHVLRRLSNFDDLPAGFPKIAAKRQKGRSPTRLRARTPPVSGGGEVRPAGIEPAACGLKDRCSLAPRREPLTTELRARAER